MFSNFITKKKKISPKNKKIKLRNHPLKEYKDSEITSINNVVSIPKKLKRKENVKTQAN